MSLFGMLSVKASSRLLAQGCPFDATCICNGLDRASVCQMYGGEVEPEFELQHAAGASDGLEYR